MKKSNEKETIYLSMLGETGDGWEKFNMYVRPVLNDLTSYSFMGKMTFFPKLKKLSVILEICESLETITGELDALRLMTRKKNNLFVFKGEHLILKDINDPEINSRIALLKDQYTILTEKWNKWLKINNAC